jgi:sugar phosphate isomerase/epimerase
MGAAIRLSEIPAYIDWLVADQRDLEIQDPGYPDYLDTDWRAEAQAGRDLLVSRGYSGRLGIHAAYDGLDLFTHDRKVREVIQTRYLQSLEFGALLNATHMVIHSPFVAFGSAFANYSPASGRKWVIDATHAALEKVLPVAQQQNCTLVIECIMDKSPFPLIELVRSFQSDHVRLSIDTGHAFIMAQDGGAPPHQWVLEGGDLLEHVHVQDVDGHADRHWAVGDGNINWFAFFRALRTLEHSPRLVLEVQEVMRSFQWLQRSGLVR